MRRGLSGARGAAGAFVAAESVTRTGTFESLKLSSRPRVRLMSICISNSGSGLVGAGTLIERAVRPVPEAFGPEELQVLPSGTASANPVRLLSTGALVTFFDQLGRSDFDYVLVDGPPLLDLIDGQLLAHWVDGMLVVSRLDRLTPQAAVELHELLEQVDAKALGVVMVGSRGSRPYTSRPTSVTADG